MDNAMETVEFECEYMKRLHQMVALAVWDYAGRMYSPVWGYKNQIEAYAPKDEAVELFNKWVEENDNA